MMFLVFRCSNWPFLGCFLSGCIIPEMRDGRMGVGTLKRWVFLFDLGWFWGSQTSSGELFLLCHHIFSKEVFLLPHLHPMTWTMRGWSKGCFFQIFWSWYFPDIPRMQSSWRAIIRNINQQPVLLGDPHLQGVFFFPPNENVVIFPHEKLPRDRGFRLRMNDLPLAVPRVGCWNLMGHSFHVRIPPTVHGLCMFLFSARRWLYLSKDGRKFSHRTKRIGQRMFLPYCFVFLVGLWRK